MPRYIFRYVKLHDILLIIFPMFNDIHTRTQLCRLCFTALIISSFPMYTFQCAVTYISSRAAFCVIYRFLINIDC